MRRNIIIAKAFDGFGIKLNLAAGGVEGVRLRIKPEIFKQDFRAAFSGQLEPFFLPEFLIFRQIKAIISHLLTGLVIKMTLPVLIAAALGKAVLYPHMAADRGQNVIIIAAFANRVDRLFHGNDVMIKGGHADIGTFKVGGAGQNNISVLGQGIPAPFMNDHGVGFLPRCHQAVEVLMMVERVAASPVDNANIGIGQVLAVELKITPGVEQHIRNPRHRDKISHPVLALGQGHNLVPVGQITDGMDRRITKAKTPARQADLAKHRGQCHPGPERLFTIGLTAQ